MLSRESFTLSELFNHNVSLNPWSSIEVWFIITIAVYESFHDISKDDNMRNYICNFLDIFNLMVIDFDI